MIEYKQTGPHSVPLAVYRDGRYVGNIVRRYGDGSGEPVGYRFQPVGASTMGLTYNSIAGVKNSIEGGGS